MNVACGNQESTPANLFDFKFPLFSFLFFIFLSTGGRKKGREGNGRGMGGKRDRESPNQAYHLIIASILPLLLHSLINFSGLESLS